MRLRSKLAKFIDGRARKERLAYLRGKREGRNVSFRRVDGLDLPESGRSSVENNLSGKLAGALNALGTVSPIIDFEMLRVLKLLWLFNPDFSQYVANIKNLGNVGHTLTVEAASQSRTETALTRLNEAAHRIYDNGAGVDGLINQYILNVAWSGAISSEDVVNFAGRRVERVVLVPVEQIRFRYEDDQYKPYQQANALGSNRAAANAFGLIPLNQNTYHYFALETVENSPYAKPPGTAAVDSIVGMQTDAVGNISHMVNKLGLLGFLTVQVTRPVQKPGESTSEYLARAQARLNEVVNLYQANLGKGLVVAYQDHKTEHTSVASDSRGSEEVFQMIEQQVMSGLNMQPAFFGRTDSTTETYADVVYNLLLAQVGNIQRLAKRRLEATYRLDLRLGGVEVDSVSVAFNRAHARDPLAEAQAQQIQQAMVLEQARCGIISPDEAAQKLGRDSAFDPEALSTDPGVAAASQGARSRARDTRREVVTFRFDKGAQLYRFVPPSIELASFVEPGQKSNIRALKKKAA